MGSPEVKVRKFILETCLSMGGDIIDTKLECDLFVVEIDKMLAQEIVNRFKAFDSANENCGGGLWEMYFWDEVNGDYFEQDYDADGDDPVAKGGPQRVETGQMIIRADEVCWTASPKHSSIYVVTETIKRGVIQEIANG